MEHKSYPLVIANETFEVIVETAMLSHTTGTMNAVINLTVDSSVLVGMNLNKLRCGIGLNFIVKSLSFINLEIIVDARDEIKRKYFVLMLSY